MQLIKPGVEIITQAPGLEGLYRQIELAGRTCYKSEDRITENSAKEFVNRMIKSGHGAMLEHGTVHLKIPVNIDVAADFLDDVSIWTKVHLVPDEGGNWWAVTTNYRRIIEMGYNDHLKYLCEPTEYHEKRVTAKFICDRGVSHEFVRHRTFSFAQESTRYCNYSKDKFGGELTFIIPSWLSYEEQQFTNKSDTTCSIRTDLSENEYFIDCLLEVEGTYNYLTQYCNWKPQQARAILPNAIKTELVMTGFVSDWEHFFELRCAEGAHPDARLLANQLREQFIERKLL